MGCLQRQFQRLVEMLILKHMDPSDERSQRAYRLQVKERLYRFNYVRIFYAIGLLTSEKVWVLTDCCLQEILMQLDKQDRQQKLEETFQSVVADYRRILGHVQ